MVACGVPYRLYNKDSGELIGPLTDDQLRDLVDLLVEESAEDQDYYIDANTIDYMEENDADPGLVAMLRRQLPEEVDEDEGFEIEWREEGA